MGIDIPPLKKGKKGTERKRGRDKYSRRRENEKMD